MSSMAKKLIDFLKKDSSVYLLVIDGWECYYFNPFKKDLTLEQQSRIINMGIQEQNAVSFAAGLALSGKKVYLVMFAAFLSTRAAEQIKLDVAYNNANVKLIGIHGGFTGPRIAGYSHWAIEDIAIINAVPNIRIFNVSANKNEIDCALNNSFNEYGPVYIRLDNPGKDLNDLNYETATSLPLVLGDDTPNVCIIATGNMTNESINLVKILHKNKVNASLYSAFKLKPFDNNKLKDVLKKKTPIITIEEHVKYGGLASIVSEQIALCGYNNAFLPITVQDKGYNVVLRDYDSAINQILGFDNILEKILKISKPNKKFLSWIYKHYKHFDNKQRFSNDYFVFGIPIVQIKSYKRNNISKKALYIMGLRLFSIKQKEGI